MTVVFAPCTKQLRPRSVVLAVYSSRVLFRWTREARARTRGKARSSLAATAAAAANSRELSLLMVQERGRRRIRKRHALRMRAAREISPTRRRRLPRLISRYRVIAEIQSRRAPYRGPPFALGKEGGGGTIQNQLRPLSIRRRAAIFARRKNMQTPPGRLGFIRRQGISVCCFRAFIWKPGDGIARARNLDNGAVAIVRFASARLPSPTRS